MKLFLKNIFYTRDIFTNFQNLLLNSKRSIFEKGNDKLLYWFFEKKFLLNKFQDQTFSDEFRYAVIHNNLKLLKIIPIFHVKQYANSFPYKYTHLYTAEIIDYFLKHKILQKEDIHYCQHSCLSRDLYETIPRYILYYLWS